MQPAPAFLLLSPLANWSGRAQTVAPGACIRRLLPRESAALESSDALLQHHDVDREAREGFWLCHEFVNENPAGSVRYKRWEEAAFKLMLHAVYSIQILSPLGAANLFLLYRRTDDGLVLDSTQHRQALLGTVWADHCGVPPSFAEEIPALLERLRDAFQKPTLRLQIPVWLLEQGMCAPDRHIRILLWATGLDGITRSGGMAAFAERLGGLLGADTKVFPPGRGGRQPKYRVCDVAEDLYLLRNEMAHGLPFHEKFRKKRGFLADDGDPVSSEFAVYRYDQVLEECAAFLLCQALREVLLHNRVFDFQTMSWSEPA